VVGVAVVVAMASAALMPFLTFDFNPLHLRSPKTESVSTLMDLFHDPDFSAHTLEVVRPNLAAAEALAARAKDVSTTAATAAQNAAAAAQTAAQTATMAAQVAAQEVTNAAQLAATNVNKGVYNARVWAAPQLESAADYTTTTLAPRVSAALHSTAQQISPEEPVPAKRSSSLLTWSFLAAAVLAAAGAAAAVIRMRYRTAMAADTEEEAAAGTTGGTTGPAGSPAADAAGTTADSGVNGRVSSSGR